jgi:hypothetical protein
MIAITEEVKRNGSRPGAPWAIDAARRRARRVVAVQGREDQVPG